MRRDLQILKREARWLSTFAYLDAPELQQRMAGKQMADMYAALVRGRTHGGHAAPPSAKDVRLFQRRMAYLFDRLTQGMTETLSVTEHFAVTARNNGAVVRPVPREHTGDAVLVEIFRVLGDRFRVCPVCGRGFFKFGRAQYCSRPCSDTGRRRVYRAKKRSARAGTAASASRPSFAPGKQRRRPEKAPRCVSVSQPEIPRAVPRAHEAGQEAGRRPSRAEIDAILAEVSADLTPRAEYWLPHGDEAADAVQRVLQGMWRVLAAGGTIENLKPYGRACLRRATAKVLRDRARRQVN